MIKANKDGAESLFSWRATEPREPTKLDLYWNFSVSSVRPGFVLGLAGELGLAFRLWERDKICCKVA